ncbi:hypothetical protein D9M73_231070 [compost metagenome]
MHVDHPHAHFRSRLDRHGRGVGNVVELEIQEYFEALGIERLDDIRGTTGEQFLADLDPAQLGVQLIGQLQRGVTGRKIQGDDDRSLADGHGWALRGKVEIGAHCSGCSAIEGPGNR